MATAQRAAVHQAGKDAIPLRRIGPGDLTAALIQGRRDFTAIPTPLLFRGVLYPVTGLAMARVASGRHRPPLLRPLARGLARHCARPLQDHRHREWMRPGARVNAFDMARSPALVRLLCPTAALAGAVVPCLIAAPVMRLMPSLASGRAGSRRGDRTRHGACRGTHGGAAPGIAPERADERPAGCTLRRTEPGTLERAARGGPGTIRRYGRHGIGIDHGHVRRAHDDAAAKRQKQQEFKPDPQRSNLPRPHSVVPWPLIAPALRHHISPQHAVEGSNGMSDPWGRKPGTGDIEQILGALGGGRGGAAGLDALIGQMRQAGLGPQLDSWIGTGANAPVAPDDMSRAFGDQELRALGGRMGLGGGALAAILAQLLPLLIDRASPQGRMPQRESDLAPQGGLGGILGGLLGGGGLGAILGGLFGDGGRAGPGEEVEPPPERGATRAKPGWPGQGASARGYPGKPGWDDQAVPASSYPDKPGWNRQEGAPPTGKPGWGDQGTGTAAGKPGWPQPGGPAEASEDPLGDLARSADRLGRRR